jgi:predicted RNase H-like HicB family nuclease
MKKSIQSKQAKSSPHAAAAAEIAGRYRLVIEARPGGGFAGSAVEMPLVLASGKTVAACFEATRAALVASVQVLLEDGLEPPAPASESKREIQFNIRLTIDEKARIEERARVAGFRSVSDYVRRSALRGTG